MEIREEIKSAVGEVLKDLGVDQFELILARNLLHGDFSTNISLTIFHKTNQKFANPLELATHIAKELQQKLPNMDRIEASAPGFINFYLSGENLLEVLDRVLSEKEKYGEGESLEDQRIVLEFAHPNTHKLFHIGHLRNISVGESLARLLQFQKGKITRANYQGDVGLHVAKAVYGLQSTDYSLGDLEKKTINEKIKFLSQAYVDGNKAYEEDADAKIKINEINKSLYEKDSEFSKLWEKTRSWSLEYFDEIYKRVGTKFDRLYFESEVAEDGKKIVLENLDKVFIKDDGAIIFSGENFGLHNRVFINSIGLPTYEGKDVGLAYLQVKEFAPDRIIHVVGPEQIGYFEVLFKALEEISPEFKNKQLHLEYGFVRLKEGKMSSRKGDVVEGEWLLDEAKKRLKAQFEKMDERTLEQVAVGAVKYSMLKFGRKSDITFSFEDSISLEGNSGPYVQYSFARTQSVLAKIRNPKSEIRNKSQIPNLKLEKEEELVLRLVSQFPMIARDSADNFAPNTLANYLFELSQAFNNFYQNHKIIGSEKEDFRLKLTSGVGQVLKNGLYLLGIEAPEKM